MEKQKFCCLEHPSTLKRRLYLWNIYRLVRQLLNRKLSSCHHFNLDMARCDENNDQVVIMTIAFNNTEVLRYQINLIKRNLKDPNYIHVIADNSPILERQKAVQELCKEYNLGYILLPKSNYLDKRSPSYSHGAAATWLYHNYICRIKPKYFGFLDHDLYPVSPVSIAKKLERQPMYGFMEYRQRIGYIWMGLVFMNFNWTLDKVINFLPCKVEDLYLDTGGSNWYSLYSTIAGKGMIFPERIRKPVYVNGEKYTDPVDYIDDCWFHTNNGSNWRRQATKNDIVERLIKEFSMQTGVRSINISNDDKTDE